MEPHGCKSREQRPYSPASMKTKTCPAIVFCRWIMLAIAACLPWTQGLAAQTGHPQCTETTRAWQGMAERPLVLLLGQNPRIALTVKVADDPGEIKAGYQFLCPEIINHSAILFDFGAVVSSRFHMRNVFAPLDIAFFRADGTLINTTVMRPEPPGFSGKSTLYSARAAYRYVLETPAGLLTGHDLVPGRTRLVLSPAP